MSAWRRSLPVEISSFSGRDDHRSWVAGSLPGKFGGNYDDRHRLLRQSEPGEDSLFGKEYVTVSNDGSKQTWVAVNEMGDAMRAGPKI